MAIHCDDCLLVLPTLESDSIDAVVTDPPYGLEFMGKEWDHGLPGESFWKAALRVAKPGTHLLAFGGTRTVHRLACAIEDAGWEIRDRVLWLYGSGFPKSKNLGNGWGTALKPAWEPIILARKPLGEGTVAANVERYGTGALNIDGCRVETDWSTDPTRRGWQGGRRPGKGPFYGGDITQPTVPRCGPENAQGRWPANLIHDGSDEVVAGFPETNSGRLQTHHKRSGGGLAGSNTFAIRERTGEPCDFGGDNGSAARFFYCAKPSRAERNAGLEEMEETITSDGRAKSIDNPFLRGETKRNNHHPTVKPLALMRYLCRMITPPGGTVLDPFMGSGTTGIAAHKEGFEFIGIEKDSDYFEIAKARLEETSRQFSLF